MNALRSIFYIHFKAKNNKTVKRYQKLPSLYKIIIIIISKQPKHITGFTTKNHPTRLPSSQTLEACR